MDTVDRAIINTLQEGFPVCDQPFAKVAGMLSLTESELTTRLQALLDEGVLNRFGPLFHTERMGGCVTLAAMKIPKSYLHSVIRVINGFPEVAHNYERTHEFNIWFVIAAETLAAIDDVIAGIEQRTGFIVYNMPKEREYFVGLKFKV
ncbi:MAG: Lrp/AsnC family transcriptional regulator [Gammaproteobacteria bacterium]|nr:Lrp/AsnC family transcriptional regulator [Gammaproteobacteria bacterium]